MINLIKNELTKIFHKKAIYIVLAITIGFMILNAILTKVFTNVDFDYGNEDIAFYEGMLAELDKNNPEQREVYITYQAQLEVAKLANKYDKDSWQRYIISRDANPIVQKMLMDENNQNAKEEYDDFIKKLNTGDWKSFAQDELNSKIAQIEELNKSKDNETNEKNKYSIELQIKIAEIEKKALDWRLEKDIPYGISNKNSILDQWVSGRQQLLNYEEQEKTKPLTYSEKIEKQDQEELVGLCEYAIVNDTKENVNIAVFNNRYNLVTSADSEFVDTFYQYALFIVIAIVIIAGTIVSEEFNKGTVKLLLVRPYKRIKILTAKFIACLIVLAIVYVFVALAQFVVGGCTYGFNNYTGKAAIYNFHTSAVETIGTFRYLLLAGVSILPKFLLIMTLAFSLSVIFVNSPIAIAIPLLGIMGEEIINELAYNFEKARFLRFFVTPNWDLSIYLFGKMPEFEPISLFFSLGICLIYFVIMLVIDMLVFKKKEIKNI